MSIYLHLHFTWLFSCHLYNLCSLCVILPHILCNMFFSPTHPVQHVIFSHTSFTTYYILLNVLCNMFFSTTHPGQHVLFSHSICYHTFSSTCYFLPDVFLNMLYSFTRPLQHVLYSYPSFARKFNLKNFADPSTLYLLYINWASEWNLV